MSLSGYGKLMIANCEFEKGVAFIAAACLLNGRAQTEPQEYVVLHLIAQGIELLMKGALYGRNYDTYKKMGRTLGHRLDAGFDASRKEFQLNPMKQRCNGQLKALSNLYSKHALRYASSQDIFIAPSSIDVSLVEARVKCAIRLGRREFRKAFLSYKSVVVQV